MLGESKPLKVSKGPTGPKGGVGSGQGPKGVGAWGGEAETGLHACRAESRCAVQKSRAHLGRLNLENRQNVRKSGLLNSPIVQEMNQFSSGTGEDRRGLLGSLEHVLLSWQGDRSLLNLAVLHLAVLPNPCQHQDYDRSMLGPLGPLESSCSQHSLTPESVLSKGNAS